MHNWPANPWIYEINAWVWLGDLSRKYGRCVTFADVPGQEWDAVVAWGFDAIWFMGVWQRSPEGIRIAREHAGLQQEYRRALPDYTDEDVVGSPYCVYRYDVDPHLGGRAGLAAARQALADRGLLLVLDFVPNHTAIDHPWINEHPEYYIQGSAGDAADRDSWFRRNGLTMAHGRDPNFPAWTDVAQLNAFQLGLRGAAIQTLIEIASQCDGVRCDMAMLLINEIFTRTWGQRAGAVPVTEYWPGVIRAVKAQYPDFVFIAEAYWDREWDLQQQGFDYCYDKRLYDLMQDDNAAGIRAHLRADLRYQNRLIRFVENHDERRVAATFAAGKHRAAALAIATVPGAKLWHEGQFEGRRVRLPVQLGRRPDEPVDDPLLDYYKGLLHAARECRGEWRLSDEGESRILAWKWSEGDETYEIVINWSGEHVRDMGPWSAKLGKALVTAGSYAPPTVRLRL